MIGMIKKPDIPMLIMAMVRYLGPSGRVIRKPIPKRRLPKHTSLSVLRYKLYLSRKPDITKDPISPEMMNIAPNMLASTEVKPYEETRLLIIAPKQV